MTFNKARCSKLKRVRSLLRHKHRHKYLFIKCQKGRKRNCATLLCPSSNYAWWTFNTIIEASRYQLNVKVLFYFFVITKVKLFRGCLQSPLVWSDRRRLKPIVSFIFPDRIRLMMYFFDFAFFRLMLGFLCLNFWNTVDIESAKVYCSQLNADYHDQNYK